MTEFLVELYIPRTTADAAGYAIDRVRRATVELTAEGTSIRFLHSIFVPTDETCLFLLEAESIDAVRNAARRAALSFEHIAETATESSWSTGDDPTTPSGRRAATDIHNGPTGHRPAGHSHKKGIHHD